MERLPVVAEGDLTYLANLCHDCRACYQACMYTPPHPFAVEIPQLMSAAREGSYEQFARPRLLARAFAGPAPLAVLTLAGTAAFVLLAWVAGQARAIFSPTNQTTSFNDVIPYAFMVVPFLLLTFFVIAAISWGFAAFWRQSHGPPLRSLSVWSTAAREIATLRWSKGGGDDCYYPDAEEPSATRRWLHHLTAYGFLAAFVSTSLAAFYRNILGEESPYPYAHPVVLFGLVGGIGMTIGTSGLLVLKRRATPLGTPREDKMNKAFIVALDAASTTGLALLFLRDTRAMGALLVLHLGTVVALYLTAPYGKFVHAVYRSAAVLRSAAERAAEATAAVAHEQRTDARVAATGDETAVAKLTGTSKS